jgi:abortive infection bacteriophage resistance protein
LKYAKPPLSTEQQVELLKSRGMVVADQAAAATCLMHINYYRLRAYWMPMEVKAETDGEHKFKEGTKLEDVLSLYEFDRRLRLLLLAAIERLEVSFRTRFSQCLSVKYGSHAHLEEKVFHNLGRHAEHLASLNEEIQRSHETFIDHYFNTYTAPDSPPIWAVTEVMSLGLLSKMFANITTFADRGDIIKPYGVQSKVVESFLHHLTHVRNLCAHHCRVWNRKFVVTFQIPQSPAYLMAWFNQKADRNVYNTLTMLAHFMRCIDAGYPWFDRLKELLNSFPMANREAMGFPDKWQEIPLWK